MFRNYVLNDVIFAEKAWDELAKAIRPMMGCPMCGHTNPKIERVIFHNPATIIYWKDGTKTVVKCQPGDVYDEEKGFALAYLKKLLGNDNTFNKEIKKYVIEPYVKEE